MKNLQPAPEPGDGRWHEGTPPNMVSASDLGERFDEVSRRVEDGDERIEIRRDGKTIAVLVPLSDLKALEALEDRLDELDAREALADYRANGGTSFEKVMAELGL